MPKMSPAKSRSRTITRSGYLFIAVNFGLAVFNFAVGLISNSLAIISDALHSLVDSISGFLVVVSEKFAAHRKFSHHRERIERATTIMIAFVIIAVGVHIVVEAIEEIQAPDEVDYSWPVMVVLIISLAAKYALAAYLTKTGKKINSQVLTASGVETMNDVLISVAVLVSAIVYLIWQVNIEAYLSLIISVIIFKVGLEFIFPHFSKHHHHHLESDPDHDHCGRSPKSH